MRSHGREFIHDAAIRARGQQEDYEVEAIGKLVELLKPMSPATRINVLQFVFKALHIVMPGEVAQTPPSSPLASSTAPAPAAQQHVASLSGAHIDLRSLTQQKSSRAPIRWSQLW